MQNRPPRNFKELPVRRRNPRQARSQLLVDSLKQACRKILTEEGETALTVAHLIETAGVEIGSLYQYFPNVDAILGEICREEVVRHLEEQSIKLRGMEGYTFEQFLEHTIVSVFRFHRHLLHFDREFYTKYPGYFGLTAYFNELCNDPAAATKNYLRFLGNRQLPEGTDPEMLAFAIDNCIDSMIERAITYKPEYLDSDAYMHMVFRMCMSMLSHHTIGERLDKVKKNKP